MKDVYASQTADSEALEYERNAAGDGFIVVGIGNCTDSKIIIPSSHAGLPVAAVGEKAFYNCTGLTDVAIPASVTQIGDIAFSGCTDLTGITVAKGNPVYHSAGNCLIETGSKTLIAGCKASTIPGDGSVTKIGWDAFWFCAGLTDVVIPVGVAVIDSGAFEDCTGLKGITIPDGATEIGMFAFRGCTGLTSVTIPDSVTEIGMGAFADCTGLTDVYYAGTEAQWAALAESADVPETATVHYNSKG